MAVFWEPAKTYLTPIDWDGGQHAATATFWRGEEGKGNRKTPRGTAFPTLGHPIPVWSLPWAG